MSDLEFVFEQEHAFFSQIPDGTLLSAAHFLAVMEGETEETVEAVLEELESRDIVLDIADIPPMTFTADTAVRLRRETQLVRQPNYWLALEENDPLRLYLEELAGIPVYGDVQLLAAQCAAGSTDAQEKLLNLSLHRVVELAQKMVGNGVLLLDLIQEGSLGLWKAIVTFRGGDFAASCDRCIQQAMAKLIALQARDNGVGQKLRQALEDYKAVDERLLSELGRNATIEEIAEQMHMQAEEAYRVKNMLDSARLVNRARAENEQEEAPEEEQHVEDTALFQMRQRISDLMSELSDAESKLLTLRFGLEGGLPLSPEQTGHRLGLTPEEVVRAETAALAKLRKL